MLKALRVMWRNTLARQFQTVLLLIKVFALCVPAWTKLRLGKWLQVAFSFVSSGSRNWRFALRSWVSAKADYLKQVAFSRGIIVTFVNEHNYSDVLSRFW